MAATQTWYYQQDSGVVGPLTSAELKRLIEQGVVRPATRIRRGEAGAWFPSEGIQVELDRALGGAQAPPPASDRAEWFFSLQDKRKLGPVTLASLGNLLKQGKLRASDLVWRAGMAAWVPASEILGAVDVGDAIPPLPTEKPAGPFPLADPPLVIGPPPLPGAAPLVDPPLVIGPPPLAGPPPPAGQYPPVVTTAWPAYPHGQNAASGQQQGGWAKLMSDQRVLMGGAAAGLVLLGVIATLAWTSLRDGGAQQAAAQRDRAGDGSPVTEGTPRPRDSKGGGPAPPRKETANADHEGLYDDAIKAVRLGDFPRATSLLEQYVATRNARRVDAARNLIREIELAGSAAKADELVRGLSNEKLATYMREGVGALLDSTLRTADLRQLYSRTLHHALATENARRRRLAKNSVPPPPRDQRLVDTLKAPPGRPRGPLESAALPKANPKNAQIPGGSRDPKPGSLTLERVLDTPRDFLGRTLVVDGLYKIGTRLFDVKGPQGKSIGTSLPVTTHDNATITTGESKAAGRDVYLLLEAGFAPVVERAFGRVGIRPAVKAIFRTIITVTVRPPFGTGQTSPLVYIVGLELLGGYDVLKVVNHEYNKAFMTLKITPDHAAVIFADGDTWVERLGGEEHYVQPLRRRVKELQRRLRTMNDSVMLDRAMQAELSRVMTLTAAAQAQQLKLFSALVGRPLF